MVRYLKRLKSSKFVRVKAFPMYGGMGVSAPSLHRESTDSLIACLYKYTGCVYSVYVVCTACGLTSHLELIKAQEVSVRGDVTGYWGYGVIGVRLVTSRGTR